MAAISRPVHCMKRGEFRALFAAALILFSAAAASLRADDFTEGNELFEQGKFGEAKQRYAKLVDAGQGTANVYYNLGNTEFRLGAPGEAMLGYERALALSPQHPESLANLNLLRKQSQSKLLPIPWFAGVFHQVAVNVWIIAATMCGWLLLFCLAYLVSSKRPSNGGAWFLGIVSALVAAVSGVGVWLGVKDQALGIIIAQEAVSRLAPTGSVGEVEKLPAGSQVRILSVRGAWTYCELPGGVRGWVPNETVKPVRPFRS